MSIGLKKRHNQKGFTLIELMLATALLMMVMFSGYYAYSLYSQKWQKRVQVFWQSTEQAIAIDSLNKMLSSIQPYIVNGQNNTPCVFFEGNSTELKFITNSSIFSTSPAMVELKLVSVGESYHLLYSEQSIADNLVLDLNHQAKWQHQIILLKNLTQLNFSYFGWNSFEQAISHINVDDLLINEDTRGWYQDHEANVSRILPEKIQFNYESEQTPSSFQVSLPQHTLYELMAYLRIGA